MKKPFASGFSLIEVTLAIGIAAFCLIAVFGLIPVGVQTNRNATSQTAATNIMASLVADMRATTSLISPQYGITLGGSAKTLYFDNVGQFTTSLGTNSRYRASVTFPWSIGNTYGADLKVTWPAAANPANTTPSGSAEMFAAFDKN